MVLLKIFIFLLLLIILWFIKKFLIMEDYEKNEGTEKKDRDEIFSVAVRAGKRTYFFDVKSTKRDDYYLTITESKKKFNPDGRHFFEKHKLFLYKEDFEKFSEGLNEVVSYIKANKPEETTEHPKSNEVASESTKDFTSVEFEELDNSED